MPFEFILKLETLNYRFIPLGVVPTVTVFEYFPSLFFIYFSVYMYFCLVGLALLRVNLSKLVLGQ